MSDPRLVPVQEADLPEMVSLNEAAAPAVNSVQAAFFRQMARRSECFLTVRLGGGLGGFLLLLPAGVDYDSLNYRYFASHYDRFAYVDRIVVNPDFRRQGIGNGLYAALMERSMDVPRITCEVNVEPPNPGSLAFHAELGFRVVAEQETEGGAKRVALMVREHSRDHEDGQAALS